MKLKFIVVGVICLLLIILCIFINCIKLNEKKIGNIKRIYFSYSTGNYNNASICYELICHDECILYFKGDGIDEEGKVEFKVEKEILKDIEERLNEYKVIKWNNFRKSDAYVLDGNSFYMSIDYGEDDHLIASGYESWPINYSEVSSYLVGVFSKYVIK